MNLSLLVIRCEDIETSKSFYESLGLSFAKEKHGNGPEHFSSDVNGTILELYPKTDDVSKDNVRLGFSDLNISSALKDVKVHSSYEYAGKTIYVVIDPDGRKVEVSA